MMTASEVDKEEVSKNQKVSSASEILQNSPLDFSVKKLTDALNANQETEENNNNADESNKPQFKPNMDILKSMFEQQAQNLAQLTKTQQNNEVPKSSIAAGASLLPGMLPSASLPGGLGTPGLAQMQALLASLAKTSAVNPQAQIFANLVQQMQANQLNSSAKSPSATTTNKTKSSQKSIRPFKAYPKDPLSFPLGYYGLPGLLPFPPVSVDNSGSLTQEQIFNLYKEQVLKQAGNNSTSVSNSTSNLSTPGTTPAPAVSEETATSSASTSMPVFPDMNPPLSSEQSSPVASPPTNSTVVKSEPGLTTPANPLAQAMAQLLNNNANSFPSTFNDSAPNSNVVSPLSVTGMDMNHRISPGMGSTPSRKRPRSNYRNRALPDDQKDEAYWERRRKNNEAAKRSRDSRRAKEDEIALRAAFLEQENLKLRYEVTTLKQELVRLRASLAFGTNGTSSQESNDSRNASPKNSLGVNGNGTSENS